MPIGNPNFYIVDTNGNATAQFAGHISAAGVDILAGTTVTPPADRKIRWHKDTITGAAIADIYGQYFGAAAGVNLRATSPVSGSTSEIGITQLDGGAGSSIHAIVDDLGTIQDKIVIDSSGVSSFMQLRVPANVRMQLGTIAGLVMPAGLSSIAINLPIAWTTTHQIFMGTINPASHNSFTIQNAGLSIGLAQGRIVTTNAGAAQVFSFDFISLGS